MYAHKDTHTFTLTHVHYTYHDKQTLLLVPCLSQYGTMTFHITTVLLFLINACLLFKCYHQEITYPLILFRKVMATLARTSRRQRRERTSRTSWGLLLGTMKTLWLVELSFEIFDFIFGYYEYHWFPLVNVVWLQ